MIQLHVISVTRKSSSEVRTAHYTYENDNRKVKWTDGAEWEEVEFREEFFDQPTIQVANITGDYMLIGGAVKLIINNPDLFGTYKVGDIINLMPNRVEVVTVDKPPDT